MHLQVISEQILILVLLALIGLIAFKLKVIQKREQDSLSKLIFNITLPILIILKIGNIEINREILVNSGFTLLFAVITIWMFYFGGKLSSNIFKLKSKSTVHTLHSTFGNTVFLGFPLIEVIYPGTNALLYATLFVLVSNSLVWTLGVYEFTKSTSQESINVFKFLLNPNTIAFAIGFIIMILPFKIPDFVNTTFTGVGNATFPLAMIYIGSVLANLQIKEILKHWHVFLVSFNKLLLFPFLLTIILYLFLKVTNWNIDLIPKMVLVLESAMPCQVIIVILAGNYNKDPELATQQLVVSTMLSILTIPVVYFFGMYFLQ